MVPKRRRNTKAKELILLFRGDASPELLKNVLIFIEERYPTVNVLIDSVGAVASLFGFIIAGIVSVKQRQTS